MDKLSLRVILGGSVDRLLQELADVKTPEYVTLSVEALPKDDILAHTVPDAFDTVLITTEIEHIAQMVDDGYTDVDVVFVGDDALVDQTFDVIPSILLDMWAGDRPIAHYQHRLERLVQELKDRYDAWLYRNWLLSLIDSLPDLVWYKEKSGLHNLVNAQFCTAVRKSFEDVKDKRHCYIWNAPPESEYQCAETDNAVMTSGKTIVADEKVETDRGLRQYRTYKSPVHGRDGSLIGTVGLAHDVTDFTNMGMELQILMGNLPYPVALANTEWRIIGSNKQFLEAFGLTKEEVEGLDYRKWLSTLEIEKVERVTPDGVRRTFHDLVVGHGDDRRMYEVSEPDIVDYFDNVSGHYCLFRDVTAERSYEKQVMQFASTDFLTGLANRRYFDACLKAHVGEPVCLINLDLDNFKNVNDTFGHLKGDEVLVWVAQTLRDEFPEGLVARQGGDEFACALRGTWDEDDLQHRLVEFQNTIERQYGSLGVGLGCSVGVASTSALSSNLETLYHEVNNLMYAQKAQHHADVPKG